MANNSLRQMVLGCNAGWSVPVCLLKQASERNITADVKSWLSSKLTRHPSVSKVEYNEAKQESMATLSCSFRITLAEDGYRWTEEIAVMLPKIYVGLASDGKSLTSSSAPANVLKNLYPSPSTTTYRRRLLIRHHAFRHKMLTYTITQRGSSIHVLFFEDHQPPLIIHNQWQHLLAIRNVSFPSDPEGIGSNFYLEYDWSLQAIAKQHCLESKELLANNEKTDAESLHFSEWLEASSLSQDRSKMPRSNSKDRTRYQIGSPQYGWSNSLWQIGGIQFASLTKNEGSALAELGLTFLIMSFYRAGSWLISITCLEDPSRDSLSTSMPPLVVPSVASLMPLNQSTQSFLKVGVILDKFLLHFCDEHDTVRDATGMMLYPDILQFSCDDVSIIFNTAPDPPEASRHNSRLGYLSHIRSYTSLYISIEHIEVGHFVQACNFPLLLSFRKTHKDNNLLQLDRVRKHERLSTLTQKLLNKKLPKSAESPCITTRIIFADTWDSITTPSFYHSIELKISPAIIQVEDDILTHLNAFIQPFFAAREGKALCRAMNESFIQTTLQNTDAWSLHAYESSVITKQRKVYIEWLKISDVQVTITARVSIPVLNSFDCTPLHFGSTKMREVFSFPDQLYKDVAANYVVDTIVCSPMLLMSLNILGNPAGFLRRFGQGVKDLVEIPLTASRNGYNPWTLTKGVAGGFTSFLSHTAAAVLTSVSGFTYSISRTMDQVTLPADQLRKRHYSRPTHLSSAVADGLESLGSSFVGAATGLVTTPIAIYKERQMQGLDTGFRNVVGSVGMGLVGIVAQPVGGIASLVSMTSDGLLYGLKENRAKLHDSPSRVNARPNELLRYKLKVLSNAFESYLVFAHGVWIIPDENSQLVLEHQAECIIEEKPKSPENDSLRGLLLPRDVTRPLAQVTVVCSKELVYVVGVTKAQNQVVLIRTSLKSIEAVEESLQEPTMFDLGIKTSSSAEWLHFRLPPQQRRHLSHHLRLLLAGDASIQV
ncbi:hypothetical protein CCR75_003672 [Bremia lactucae]|uniref:Vacuolar protein sorting-associated protein 13 DH-like domain-containing protein n=1 Tax=Bremia lactucae TaxID=4779 RepID=A0A976NY81_BRELC|nr:hypothetical protein CCR75_003672 [Bremia lactucae]